MYYRVTDAKLSFLEFIKVKISQNHVFLLKNRMAFWVFVLFSQVFCVSTWNIALKISKQFMNLVLKKWVPFSWIILWLWFGFIRYKLKHKFALTDFWFNHVLKMILFQGVRLLSIPPKTDFMGEIVSWIKRQIKSKFVDNTVNQICFEKLKGAVHKLR